MLPDDPANLVGTGRQHATAALVGYAADEGKFFQSDAPKTLGEASAFIRARFGDGAIQPVLHAYHVETDAHVPAALATFFGDHEILASTVLTARTMSKRNDVYVYQFSRVAPQTRFSSATHTSEIPYVFGTLRLAVPRAEPVDAALADAMAGAWVRFATSGNPNGPGLPEWPSYARPAYQYLNYGDRISMESGYRTSEIAFSERLLANQRHAASR